MSEMKVESIGFQELAGSAVNVFENVSERNSAPIADAYVKKWSENFDAFADSLVSSYIEFCDEAVSRPPRK